MKGATRYEAAPSVGARTPALPPRVALCARPPCRPPLRRDPRSRHATAEPADTNGSAVKGRYDDDTRVSGALYKAYDVMSRLPLRQRRARIRFRRVVDGAKWRYANARAKRYHVASQRVRITRASAEGESGGESERISIRCAPEGMIAMLCYRRAVSYAMAKAIASRVAPRQRHMLLPRYAAAVAMLRVVYRATPAMSVYCHASHAREGDTRVRRALRAMPRCRFTRVTMPLLPLMPTFDNNTLRAIIICCITLLTMCC